MADPRAVEVTAHRPRIACSVCRQPATPPVCADCGEDWPCPVARLGARIALLQRDVLALREKVEQYRLALRISEAGTEGWRAAGEDLRQNLVDAAFGWEHTPTEQERATYRAALGRWHALAPAPVPPERPPWLGESDEAEEA